MSSTGDIAAKWQSLKTDGLDLGFASEPEEDAGWGGRVQVYQNGRIYWHAQVGTHEVHGAILAKYLQLGGPGNHPITGRRELGFPQSDEKQTPEGFAHVSTFEWGAIYFGYDAGAVPLYGPIYQEWAAKYPLASVVEGFPLIEPFALPNGVQAAVFSNGFAFTFGPHDAVYAGHYHGPMPGKPDVVMPETRDIAVFDVVLPVDVWQAIQQQQPNLLTKILLDRLVLQRVDNPRSHIPLVIEQDGAEGGFTGGTSGGVVTETILTGVVSARATTATLADPVVRDHRGQPSQGAPSTTPSEDSPIVRDHRTDLPANPNTAHITMRLNVRLAPGALMKDRSLYNIAVKTPNGSAAAIGLHAIYAKQAWHNFGMLHVTDIHITGRADALYATLRARGRQESLDAFNNMNDGFRDFIRYANHLHDRGLIDLIIATGDLVDYQFEGDPPTDLGGNFLLFEYLLRGWSPSPKGTPVEELHVPIFTTLGNHDYRKIPYELLVNIDVPLQSDPTIANYEHFNLTKADVTALQGGTPTISSGEALAQVRVNRPQHYFKRINTVADDGGSSYLIRLGPNHRIVMLDSKYDIGILEGQWDAFEVTQLGIGGEDKTSFADGAPNQVGVSDAHLSLLSQALAEAGGGGVVITGIHGPPINIKGAEFAPYFRETEHPFADKRDVIAYLTRQAPPGHFPVGQGVGPQTIVVKQGDKIIGIVWNTAEKIARDLHPGWMTSLGHPFFMSGTVDDLLDRDVSKGRMDDFLKLCAGVSIPGVAATRPVDLVLCGHGHNRVEYRLGWDASRNRMLYFTDFYTENPAEYYGTLKGSFDFGNQRVEVLIKSGAPLPGTPRNNIQDHRWDGEEWTMDVQPYGDPLNAARDKAAWWAQRRPLLVETAALGPIGSGSNDRHEPNKRKPNPIFQGFRVISVSGKNISTIRYVTLREVRASNFKLPFEDAGNTSPADTTGPVVTKG